MTIFTMCCCSAQTCRTKVFHIQGCCCNRERESQIVREGDSQREILNAQGNGKQRNRAWRTEKKAWAYLGLLLQRDTQREGSWMHKGMRNNWTELGELRKKLEVSQVCCCTEREEHLEYKREWEINQQSLESWEKGLNPFVVMMAEAVQRKNSWWKWKQLDVWGTRIWCSCLAIVLKALKGK